MRAAAAAATATPTRVACDASSDSDSDSGCEDERAEAPHAAGAWRGAEAERTRLRAVTLNNLACLHERCAVFCAHCVLRAMRFARHCTTAPPLTLVARSCGRSRVALRCVESALKLQAGDGGRDGGSDADDGGGGADDEGSAPPALATALEACHSLLNACAVLSRLRMHDRACARAQDALNALRAASPSLFADVMAVATRSAAASGPAVAPELAAWRPKVAGLAVTAMYDMGTQQVRAPRRIARLALLHVHSPLGLLVHARCLQEHLGRRAQALRSYRQAYKACISAAPRRTLRA